jgi:hypothetical protein
MTALVHPVGSFGRLPILAFAAIIGFAPLLTAQGRGGGQRGGGQRGGAAAAAPAPSLIEQFDTNGDKWLNATERKAARDSITNGARGRGRGGGQLAPELAGKTAPQGPAMAEKDAKSYPNARLYDEGVLRTLFFTFENSDWEKELEDFRDTDVLVPANMVVDGKTYRNVGVRFRGNSSFFRVPSSFKRSFNVSLDMADDKQDIDGHKSLNLLNSNEDPTMMRAVLFFHIARQFLPAPKANFVRVVINGEYWGVFQNVQQFSSELVKEAFNGSKGARWKAEGPLTYVGDNVASYRRPYEIKGTDDPAHWEALINLTRILNQTPAGELEKALEPILNIDGALRFLALDNALVSNDGYWVRGADYSIYRHDSGKFHILPYDVNETFANSPSRNGQGGSPTLDPLAALTENRPLRSKLFAVPALREKYLGYVREISTKWLDWNTLGPLTERYRALIDADVKIDTKKLYSYDEFLAGIAGSERSLKTFAADRRAFLNR